MKDRIGREEVPRPLIRRLLHCASPNFGHPRDWRPRRCRASHRIEAGMNQLVLVSGPIKFSFTASRGAKRTVEAQMNVRSYFVVSDRARNIECNIENVRRTSSSFQVARSSLCYAESSNEVFNHFQTLAGIYEIHIKHQCANLIDKESAIL